MSEIQVGQINSTDGSTAITTGADGYVSFAKTQIGGRKNLIINGDCRIDQRNGGSAITSVTTGFAVDRFFVLSNTTDLNAQQSTVVPSGTSFQNSVKVWPNATKTPTSGTYALVGQRIEGNNMAHLKWGTSDAQDITVSFWIRSTKTGTYSFTVKNASASRTWVEEITINTADTWERKEFTITGCPDGSWPADNTRGMTCDVWLAGENTENSTVGSWYSGNINMSTNQVNFFDDTNNELYWCGLQVEVGTVATPFEHRSYGEELALCQRYYYRMSHTTGLNRPFAVGYADNTSNAYGFTLFPVTMRDQPSAIEQSNTASHYEIRDAGSTRTCTGVPAHANASRYGAHYYFTASGLTAGRGVMLRASGNDGYLGWSAEL